MCFDKFKFTLGIVEETFIFATIEYHLTDGTCLEEKGRVGIKNGFGRTEGINEVTCSDGAYATDGVKDEKRDEGVYAFDRVMAARDGCDWDAQSGQSRPRRGRFEKGSQTWQRRGRLG